MSLEVGIVGLPNSGKSTLFNGLMKRQIAEVAEYPFTTIEPNVGVVEVPDERLQQLAGIVSRLASAANQPAQAGAKPAPIPQPVGLAKKPDGFSSGRVGESGLPAGSDVRRAGRLTATRLKVVPAAIKFIDIAGLVKDAHKGAGLGNQFLAKIRECDAILHVVREFENPQVAHVLGSIDPKRDIEIINEELRQAGIEKPIFVYLNKDYPDELVLDTIIKECYKLLDLITMFTIVGGRQTRQVGGQVQAWPIKRGLTVWQAAGKIHSDFAEKFIKAEVIVFEELVEASSYAEAKAKGQVRIEGKDYILNDGDVVTVKI